jgi:hypothetical protein
MNSKPLKFGVTDEIIEFILNAKDGKFTEEKPDLTQITYRRLEFSDESNFEIQNIASDDFILYGTSY